MALIKNYLVSILIFFVNIFFIRKRIFTLIEYLKLWNMLSKYLLTDSKKTIFGHNYTKYKLIFDTSIRLHTDKYKNLILDSFYQGDEVLLKNGNLIFPDRISFWLLMHEILIDEDLYFETNSKTPYIIDCGTHLGLSIYYFKYLYPDSRIIGFEPNPENREIALNNVKRNTYTNVEILPYALFNNNEVQNFNIPKEISMAGSLADRSFSQEYSNVIEVKCCRLIEYLNEPVNLLKLDVEGVETIILEDSKNLLKNVQYIFCEYHFTSSIENNMHDILKILDEAEFEYQVGKSFANYTRTTKKPFNYIDERLSIVIWAKNKNWKFE